MRETLDRMLAGLREYWSKLPRNSRIRLIALGAAVIVMSIVVVALLTRTKWVEVSRNADSFSDIQATLSTARIKTKVEDDYVILVPEGSFEDAQTAMLENGLIGTPSFDDYYLSQSTGFGITAEQAKKNYERQLGSDLTVQLKQNPRVTNAFVTVNYGETSPFRIQTNTRRATANVQVVLNDSGTLNQTEVEGIFDMVKNSIPGIEYEDITIVDQNFKSYKQGDEIENREIEFDQRIALKNRYESMLSQKMETLLVPLYAPGNTMVQVNVKLNFDKKESSVVEFDVPIEGEEQGLARSTEELREWSRQWGDAVGIPGTDNNAMGTAEYPYADFDAEMAYWKELIGINYELNETRSFIEYAVGEIESVTATVLINSDYLGEEEAGPEHTDEVRSMVATTIGALPNGVTVSYLPFTDTTEADLLAAQEAMAARERRDRIIEQILKYGTIILLGVMVALLARSVVNTLRPPPEPEAILAAEGPMGGIDFMIEDETIAEAEAGGTGAGDLQSLEEIDLNQKSAALEQIERFIDKDPAAVAQLLRNWLSEDM